MSSTQSKNAPSRPAGQAVGPFDSTCILEMTGHTVTVKFILSESLSNDYKRDLTAVCGSLTPGQLAALSNQLSVSKDFIDSALKSHVDSRQTSSLIAPLNMSPSRLVVPPAGSLQYLSSALPLVNVTATTRKVPAQTSDQIVFHPWILKTMRHYFRTLDPIIDTILDKEANETNLYLKPSVRFQNLESLAQMHSYIAKTMSITRAEQLIALDIEFEARIMILASHQPSTQRTLMPLLLRSTLLAKLWSPKLKSQFTNDGALNFDSIGNCLRLRDRLSFVPRILHTTLERLGKEVTPESAQFYRDFSIACQDVMFIFVYTDILMILRQRHYTKVSEKSCKYEAVQQCLQTTIQRNDSAFESKPVNRICRPIYDVEEYLPESLQYDLSTISLKNLMEAAKDDVKLSPFQLEHARTVTLLRNAILRHPNFLVVRLFAVPLLLLLAKPSTDSGVVGSQQNMNTPLVIKDLYPNIYDVTPSPAAVIKQEHAFEEAAPEHSNKRSMNDVVEDQVIQVILDDQPSVLKKVKKEC